MQNLKLVFFSICLIFPKLILAQGTINTLAGNGTNTSGLAYYASVSPDRGAIGNAGSYYFIDGSSIRKISPPGIITTITETTPGFWGDGGPASAAQLQFPRDIVIDTANNIYIADYANHRIRKIDGITGIITTIAGNGQNDTTGDGGPALTSSIGNPYSLAIDGQGQLYVGTVSRVRKIDLLTGTIHFVSGVNGAGLNEGGLAINAEVTLAAMDCDTAGNLYLYGGFRVRKIDVSNGIINTIAGIGINSNTGDGGPASQATIFGSDIALDRSGNIYIAAYIDNTIRMINTQGIISTVAGNGTSGFSGDGGPATSAQLKQARAVAVDSCGSLYIADQSNNRIRMVTNLPCSPLHIENALHSQHVFACWPNPTTSQLIITSSTTLKEISITNTLGQTVQQQSYNAQKAILNIEHLQPGIYFVNATDAGGNRKIEKIIKQ